MAIRPIDLPSAAGLEYGRGDVRHFSEGDAVSVPGISNPTRHLAERDNQIRDKLNEVIGIVNNTEQFVPLPLVRTSLAPNDEVVAANYRIPAGFEARVLNASVAAAPASTDIALIVYYNNGFGGNTGTEVVSTASEFTGGVQFYSEGEFIVIMRNTGPLALDFASSVLLTLRPLGAQGTLLVGSTVVGPEGPPGVTGAPGPQGPAGSGGTGTKGMIWRGEWASAIAYSVDEVVSFLTGVEPTRIISSFICILAHTSSPANQPPNPSDVGSPTSNTWWQAVAVGSAGATGPEGDKGDPGGSAEIPVYRSQIVYGTLTTGGDWNGEPVDGFYNGASMGPGQTIKITLHEVYIESSTGGASGYRGFACLSGRYGATVRGSATLALPKVSFGARANYTNDFIQVNAIANGTASIDTTTPSPDRACLCTSVPLDADKFTVKIFVPPNALTSNLMTAFTVFGVQPVV